MPSIENQSAKSLWDYHFLIDEKQLCMNGPEPFLNSCLKKKRKEIRNKRDEDDVENNTLSIFQKNRKTLPIIKLSSKSFLFFIRKFLISKQQKELPHTHTLWVCYLSSFSCLVHMFNEWKRLFFYFFLSSMREGVLMNINKFLSGMAAHNTRLASMPNGKGWVFFLNDSSSSSSSNIFTQVPNNIKQYEN